MKVPRCILQAELAPAKGKEDARLADLKWYTGAAVQRWGWDGKYLLTLSMKPEHVRMGRLTSGKAPLLNSHGDWSLSDVIGVIESADLKGNASVRFSNRPEVDGIWRDVQDGIIRNASVGAAIHKLKDITEKDEEGNEKTKSFLAVDWEPMEVSLVPIGADPDAGLRLNEKSEFTEAEIVDASGQTGAATARMEEVQMPKETPTNAGEETRIEQGSAQTGDVSNQDRDRAVQLGIDQERARVEIINESVKALRLPQSFADQHIKDGTSIDVFRKLAIDRAKDLQAAQDARAGIQGTVATAANDPRLRDEADSRRFAMTGALLERFEPGAWAHDERERTFTFSKERGQRLFQGSKHYIGMSLLDIAKECLALVGTRWQSLSKAEIARLAFQTTSDFPYILADSANKSLRAGYEMAESQWRLIAARRTANDFKTMYELTLDQSSRLAQVKESGEFTRGALIEGRESWVLKTYGKIIAITRQAIINDDLGAFTRVPMMLGQEVAMLEADTVFGIITTNGNLADVVALFEADTHKNYIASTAAISVTSLAAARVKMALQTSTGGKTMGLVPRFLLAPATVGTVAEQYCSVAYQAAQSSNINPFAGKLVPIVEPRLDATDVNDWYLFADPNTPNGVVLIYAYLEGQEGPYTETRQGFDVDGTEVKIRHDFAAAAVDYRGAVKTAGA